MVSVSVTRMKDHDVTSCCCAGLRWLGAAQLHRDQFGREGGDAKPKPRWVLRHRRCESGTGESLPRDGLVRRYRSSRSQGCCVVGKLVRISFQALILPRQCRLQYVVIMWSPLFHLRLQAKAIASTKSTPGGEMGLSPRLPRL